MRRSALFAAVSLKLKTPDVIRRLIERLDDSELSASAADSLAQLGSIPNLPTEPLRRAFAHDNYAYRVDVIRAVWLCRLPTDAALPLLRMGLADPEYHVRATTVYALSEVRPVNPTVENLMIDASRDAHPEVRSAAAGGMIDVVPRGKVLPILDAMIQDSDCQVRAAAIEVLRKLRRIPPKLATRILGAATDPDDQVRSNVACAIEELQISGPRAISVLVRLLQDEAVETCYYAAYALQKKGRRARAAVPALKHALNHEDRELQQAAYDALKKIRPASVRGLNRPKSDECGGD